MKKLKLNLDEIKVESFETASVNSRLGTVFGQLPEQPNTEVVNCTAEGCNGGGANPTYATYCGTCPAGTCALTCGDTWCQSCVQCYGETQYNSCHCTDPAYDMGCNWWYPTNACF